MSARWLFATLLLAAMASSAAAGAAPEIVLRTAAQDGAAPKFTLHADGQVGGICIEVMRAIEKIEPSLRFSGDQQVFPLPRIERMLEVGELDLACALINNTARAAKFQFIEPPLYQAHYGFAIRRGDPARPTSWDDVHKMGNDNIVLAVAGSGVIERLKRLSHQSVDSSATTPQGNLIKLKNRRGRFFYYRLQGLSREIESAGLSEEIEILPTAIDSYSFQLALFRAKAPLVQERLSDALLKLQQSGELGAIIARWQP
ncbi:transporter substrate-binding domain-containing protein [Chitinimonas arctica]|uniref:Transporter substrate-binding domain-containing protein n=1 Tax=Chitinimonas arctica TaxID=2594795 RepID=A0A516SF43_9NEIS|nr:transporter substrate-binding domain-containing protein [Chitinimonas arctica]QDQ26763.1 transporter substrate-binding domain-containing protein [Chitinimonas arctica]